MPYITTFLRSQLFVTLPYPESDFTNQVIIVTGSNTGLGLEAARHFLRLNATKVILAVRTSSKGESAAADLIASTKRTKSSIEVWPLDLCSYESVKAFGARVGAMDRLDVLVQNAGTWETQWHMDEGEERTITVNVISATLLCLLVLPKLRDSAGKHGSRGRFSFCGSDTHYMAKFNEGKSQGSLFEALRSDKSASMTNRFNVSKLLLLYACRYIATLSPVMPRSNVIINYNTAGACRGDIAGKEISKVQKKIMETMMFPISRTLEMGSRALVDAVKPDVAPETHGRFLMNCEIVHNGENVDGPDGQKMQERFCKELFAKLEVISPGITDI